MSRELTPRYTRYARARQRPSPTLPLPGEGPSAAPGGLDVASFQPPPFAGAALWREIHLRALAHRGDIDDTPFIDSVTSRLPCSTCRPAWLAFLAAMPPVFGPGYFVWTVAAHNEVNARLGKPILSAEQALEIWQRE